MYILLIINTNINIMIFRKFYILVEIYDSINQEITFGEKVDTYFICNKLLDRISFRGIMLKQVINQFASLSLAVMSQLAFVME